MPVAIVTGSNKGIGFGIVRSLCKKFDGDVILTSRNEEKGKDAVNVLNIEGLNPKFHLLDICSEKSVIDLRDFLMENYGGIDVLVNNAGVAFTDDLNNFFADKLTRDIITFGHQARVTLDTNYWATKKACEILFPILKPGARVVNVSSTAGYLGQIGGYGGNQDKAESIKETLSSSDLSVDTLDKLMINFVETAEAGTHSEHGWPFIAYMVSKVGLSALSRIQQKMMDNDPRCDIVVNHVHPGFVDTDLATGNMNKEEKEQLGALTIDRGAESSVFAALLPSKTKIRGSYLWHDCQEVDWVNGPLPSPW